MALSSLIHKMVRENEELRNILQGEDIMFDGWSTMAASTDERKFYTLDETYEAIQKRYDLKAEFLGFKSNIRGAVVVG